MRRKLLTFCIVLSGVLLVSAGCERTASNTETDPVSAYGSVTQPDGETASDPKEDAADDAFIGMEPDTADDAFTGTEPDTADDAFTVVEPEAAPLDEDGMTEQPVREPKIHAPVYCIYAPKQEQVLFGRDCTKETPMASTTKIMSALVFLEHGDMDASTSLSEDAVSVNRQEMDLETGDRFSNEDLFRALLIVSSNSAGVALAQSAAGSESAFVDLMNEKANELGFKHTHYENPHGLDAPGHHTTALELSQLTAYAFSFPEFRENVHVPKTKIHTADGEKTIPIRTTDLLVADKEDLPSDAPGWLRKFSDKGFLGGKTGMTLGAGYAFTGLYRYHGKDYILTEIGAPDEYSRWEDVRAMIEFVKEYC